MGDAPRCAAAESLLDAPTPAVISEEPPYSLTNELRYFFTVGMPLCASQILKLGVPPFCTMIIAGHTSDSASLQASLGFARTLYNTVVMMPLMALCSYFATVLPGCLGAGRLDRIPRYFWRSILMTSVFILPAVTVLIYAEPVMLAVGVPRVNAVAVGVYARLMIATCWLQLLDNHLEALFINFKYVRLATLNALLSGVGINVGCSYLFVMHLELGMKGAALAQLAAFAARVLLWMAMLLGCGLTRTALLPPKGSGRTDPLVSLAETCVYFGQAAPQYGSMMAGWLIFELQVVLLTNIPNVTLPMRSAGSVWINCEGTMAAIQSGWIQVARMRALKLMGRRDPGASRSFAVLLLLATAVVTLVNVPLLTDAGGAALSRLLSNDPAVVHWFRGLVWVLIVHTQTRIVDLTCASILVPMGWARTRLAVIFTSFWLVGAPISIVGALTDALTTHMLTKLQLCMLCAVIGQTINAVCYGGLLLQLDWGKAAHVIAARANTDRSDTAGRSAGHGHGATARLVAGDAPRSEPPAVHSIQQQQS